MSLIDLILNLAALLLWLNWRAIDFQTISSPRVSIVSNLKKLNRSPSRWIFLGILIGVLVLRAVIYWQLGTALDWVGKIPFGPVTLSFRSDFWWRIFLYSFLSFGVVLGVFYAGLLLLSILNIRLTDADPLQKLVRLHLGWIDRAPLFVKALLPLIVCGLSWILLRPVLLSLQLIPTATSFRQTLEQAALIGLNAYFVWKYYLITIIVLYALNSYVYFGSAPLWAYISQTGRKILFPVHWARIWKIDFGPLIAVPTIYFGSMLMQFALNKLFRTLAV